VTPKRAGDKGYDSDEVLDPRDKAKRDKEKELAADLNAAKDLLGTVSLGGRS
jgi:translation initiation factor 3 subunit J